MNLSIVSVAARLRFLAVAAALLLSGCATVDAPAAPENITPVAPMADTLAPYRIQVGDVIQIKMYLNPEFDQEVVVRPDGYISTNLVQDAMAYGRTPSELQQALIVEYKKQLTNPQLTVVIRSFAPVKVYVLGEVQQPGEFVSVGPAPTMLQAIARAGGIKNSARTSSIVILRRGSSDKPEVYKADYDTASSGMNPASDVRLASYDVVFVPKTAMAEIYTSYDQALRQFLPSSFGLSYSLNK